MSQHICQCVFLPAAYCPVWITPTSSAQPSVRPPTPGPRATPSPAGAAHGECSALLGHPSPLTLDFQPCPTGRCLVHTRAAVLQLPGVHSRKYLQLCGAGSRPYQQAQACRATCPGLSELTPRHSQAAPAQCAALGARHPFVKGVCPHVKVLSVGLSDSSSMGQCTFCARPQCIFICLQSLHTHVSSAYL